MKKKKNLFIVYGIIVFIFVTIAIKNILVATKVEFIDEKTEQRVSYGVIRTEKVNEEDTDNINGSSLYDTRESIASKDALMTQINNEGGVFQKDLRAYINWFCIQYEKPMPKDSNESNATGMTMYAIASASTGDNLGTRFVNAVNGNIGGARGLVNSVDVNNIYIDFEPAHVLEYANDRSKQFGGVSEIGGPYEAYSRKIDTSKLTIKTIATKNATEKVLGTDKVDENMRFREAYILAKSGNSTTGNIEGNIYQAALYADLEDQNYDKDAHPSISEELENEYNKLRKESLAFEQYRDKSDYKELPSVADDKKYKFKFVKDNQNGDYLIAGPIKINYKEMNELYEDQELTVRKISEYRLYGENRNGDEFVIDQDKYEFTDQYGETLEEGALTKTYDDGNGNEVWFPSSGREFYIKVPYSYNESSMYSNAKAITRFEFDFSYLDAEAAAYEISDNGDALIYYKWDFITKSNTNSESAIGKHEKCTQTYTTTVGGCPIHPSVNNTEEVLLTRYPEEKAEVETGSRTVGTHQYLPANAPAGAKPTTLTHTLTARLGAKTHRVKETYYKKVETEYGDLQDTWIVRAARLYWRRYKITIEFKTEEPPPSHTPTPSTVTPSPVTPTPTPTPIIPPPSHTPIIPPSHTPIIPSPPPHQNQTYIDIGGKVFVDMPVTNKDDIENLNSIYDEGHDYLRKNVLVKLYFADGTPVRTGANLLKSGEVVHVINNGKNNSNFEMYTDDFGEYMFYDLPMGYKYYVEFAYDGITYEISDYLETSTSSNKQQLSNEQKEAEYDNAIRNRDITKIKGYFNSSLVKEETDRLGFNNKFAEILGDTLVNTVAQRTNGKTSAGAPLEYISKDFSNDDKDKYESRLITTDNLADLENDPNTKVKTTKQTGKALEQYLIKARVALDYPREDSYLVWDTVNKDKYLEYLKHINLGLKLRDEIDFSINTTVKAGGTTIKDKEKVVFYGLKNSAEDIDISSQVDEYIKHEISASDYYWSKNFNSIYNEEKDNLGFKISEDQLNVYVLYKMDLKMESQNTDNYGMITGLVDYFDKSLALITDPNEIAKASNLFKTDTFNVPSNAISWYVDEQGRTQSITWNTDSIISISENEKYNKIKADGLNIKLTKDSTTATVYLILKVANNGSVLYTGTGTEGGMKNIAEIASYKTYNADETSAGLIDRDSAPNNAIPGNKTTYEDDTDSAPMFQLIINWDMQEISGNAWDDVNKDGILNDGQSIKNVKVELIEYVPNKNGGYNAVVRPGLTINSAKTAIGTEKDDKGNLIKSKRTDENGKYSYFVESGNYQIRFTYGDEEMLKDVADKKYNAQDYMATQYVALNGLPEYNTENSKAFETVNDLIRRNTDTKVVMDNFEYDFRAEYGWNPKARFTLQSEAERNWIPNSRTTDRSNAREDVARRVELIKNTVEITNSKATLLHKLSSEDVIGNSDARELSNKYTKMECISDIIAISSNDLVAKTRVVNLGLKQRPEASIELEKTVKRITLTTTDGVTLIDTGDVSKVTNLAKDPDGNAIIYFEALAEDGAVIDIYYNINVKNAGSDDKLINYKYVDSDKGALEELAQYLSENFFNKQKIALGTSLPIRASKVYDYVNMNLEFRKEDNIDKWIKVYDEGDRTNKILEGLITEEVKDEIGREKRVVAKVLSVNTENLRQGEDENIELHLGITLAENTGVDLADEFVYSNCAEIVEWYSGAGRVDYGTTPGNYVPYSEGTEVDESLTGTTTIIPPTGEDRATYITLPIISASIIIIGIIIIKKKVLGK